MIYTVCSVLRRRLEGLPYIDLYAGLTQVVQYRQEDENGNPQTKRMPVSYDTNQLKDCGQEKALTPDSKRRGIVYFEDAGGISPLRPLSGDRVMQRFNGVCVCWLNRKQITGEGYAIILPRVYDDFTRLLKTRKDNKQEKLFPSFRVSVRQFRQDPDIFSKYTYDETQLQYLRPPFDYFAIDISVFFVPSCPEEISINPSDC